MNNLKPTVSKVPKNLPPGSIMLDNNRENALPDLAKLTGQIIELLEYIEIPEIKQLSKTNFALYRHQLEEKFDEFSLNYYSIFKMLIDNEAERAANVDRLFRMIDKLKDIDTGKSNVESEFIKVREELAEEFLYPKFGGKDGFQKALEKDSKNKKKH